MREKKNIVFPGNVKATVFFQMMFNFQFIIALAAEFGHCIRECVSLFQTLGILSVKCVDRLY